VTGNAQFKRDLTDGWLLASSEALGVSGQDISAVGFAPDDPWLAGSVPSTVLGTLIERGQYKDPYFGMNLAAIPTESFERPWWYRNVFTLCEEEAAKTVLLEFDGINYAATIWLNGRQIATSDEVRGAFRRFQFDVSKWVHAGDNVLAVEVVPPKPGDFSTGFVDWNCPPPDRNTGLFRPVRLRFCHGFSIENPVVQTQLDLATLAEADLTISLDLVNHSREPISGNIEGQIETIRFASDIDLGPGQRRTITFTADDCAKLHFNNPRLWWPYELGSPELYDMDLQFSTGSDVSDAISVRFGIRHVADYWTREGHRGFVVNGRKVLIKGAGWSDDLLLGDTAESIDAQLRYVRHMNLNCIRCEGIWGKDQTLYDLCDQYGILVMVGWSCHWEHEQYLGKPADEQYGGIISPEDIDLIARSWQDQLLWLRNHPSIFVWAVASDKIPAPDLERRYIDIFAEHDPTRPYLASTGGVGSEQRIIGSFEIVSQVSGNAGVKMLGPYAYTPPVYWYTDTQRGGAYGFNTETCPGAVVPTLESLKKMLPADHLWPIDEYWDFHCALNEFDSLDRYRKAIASRYGQPSSLEDFARKSQTLNYELMRPMFEAFRVNKGRATGVVQWMLNTAWPKMYWQLYDWYLVPTGAFYGAKKACASPQLVYNYGDNGVYLVDDRLIPQEGLKAEIRLYDINSRLLLDTQVRVDSACDNAERVFDMPPFDSLSTAYFLSLRLSDSQGREVAENFYWLSTVPDVLDYDAKVTPWEFYTPSKVYADMTLLNSMTSAKVCMQNRIEGDTVIVQLANKSDRIAFFTEMLLLDRESGEPVVPVFWEDNFISLLPRETRTIVAHLPASGLNPTLEVRGWNTTIIR